MYAWFDRVTATNTLLVPPPNLHLQGKTSPRSGHISCEVYLGISPDSMCPFELSGDLIWSSYREKYLIFASVKTTLSHKSFYSNVVHAITPSGYADRKY